MKVFVRLMLHMMSKSTDLMLIYLEHDGLQDEGGRWAHSEGLFGLGQPVNEILQWVMEVCGHRQGLLQFHL